MTIFSAYQEFIITQKLKGNSEKTIQYYYYCLTPLLSFLGDQTDTFKLPSLQLRQYVSMLLQRPISSNSCKSYIKGIKAFLNWIFQEGYTVENLSNSIHLPKAQRKTIDTLTANEVRLLFNSFDTKNYLGLRNYCICALMLDSGLRKSEIIRLKVEDLHIVEGYIIVNGKGNKQRIVPIGFNCQKHLIKYLSFRPITKNIHSLFLTQNFTPITASTIERLFTKLKIVCFIPRIRPHLLRHTFATRYLENGGNIYALQQILGHSSLDMVKKYVHLTTHKNVVNFCTFSPLDNI